VLLGGLFAGSVYVKVAKHLKTEAAAREKNDESKDTLYSKLNTNPNITLLVFEALLVFAITMSSRQASPRYLLDPILGGLGIGVSQLASVVLSGQALGISGAFEEFGAWLWYAVDGVRGQQSKSRPAAKNIHFALSVMLGTFLLRRLRPEFAITDNMPISDLRGFWGGFAMIFGSRLAGGCTSGHGITGMSLLSVSSIISVAAMFAGGMVLSLLVR
jgi:uncharacterized membrane protein YedE/YeeE